MRACTRQEDYTVPDGLLDEDKFHSLFEEFCKRAKVPTRGRRLQLYNKLRDSCRSIIKISQGISRPGPDKDRPESLVWKTSLAALELGCKHGASYDPVVDLQVALHKIVPTLANLVSNQDRWSSSRPVQEALKNIYEMFIKFHMDVINACTTKKLSPNQSLLTNKPFETILEEARNSLSNAKDTYDLRVKTAEESEAASSAGQSGAYFQPPKDFSLEFQTVKEIGKGAHGTVYRVEEKTTKELYACKDIQLANSSLEGMNPSEVKDEILILKKLHHTHIVTISAYSQTRTGFRILMQPLADYDLKDFLIDCAKKGFPPIKTETILPWFECLLHALEFAHRAKVKHRDIKPGNILVKDSHVYLSDFSLAKDFSAQDTSVAVGEVAAGTMRYRAPETKNNGAGGRQADVFSLGCVYSEMLTVVCGRSFEELCEWRKAQHSTDLFRESLPAVRTWLRRLRSESPNDKKRKVSDMCKTIHGMIEEELDIRHSTQQALASVKVILELRCVHIH